MKIIKNKKALSPVIAAIILVAVTVAVSIAVAAWMGTLTSTFMGTEQLKITNVQFSNSTATKHDIIYITANNTGTSPVTINEVWVNNQRQNSVVENKTGGNSLPLTVSANAGIVLKVTLPSGSYWVAGGSYQIKLVTSKGNQFYYTATAPTS